MGVVTHPLMPAILVAHPLMPAILEAGVNRSVSLRSVLSADKLLANLN